MAYKALYRTYRPQKFSEVIGQDHIVRTLQNALASRKISHAYLFSGPRGTGKTSVARIFAKALNCEKAPTAEPCGECISCREISESNNPDVVEIDAASNNGVDEIRDIRDKVKFLPGGSKYKIYIIDEVHMLTQGAFNALLKTLEEPPKHVIFILATTEPHKVLPTILSRCQRFDFKTLSVQEISQQIEKVARDEHFRISQEAIVAIAEGAEGGMRDALSYLDQAASFTDDEITIDDVNSVTGNLNYDKIIELARYFEEKNINQALKTINDLVIMGKEISKIVSGMLQFYRDVLLFKTIDTSMFSKYIFGKEEFKKLVAGIDTGRIFYYVDILSEIQAKIKTTSTPNIYLDVAVIKMINLGEEELDYRKRIKDLEEKVMNLPHDAANGNIREENERVDSLETRLDNVIKGLNNLELHKLDERIRILETCNHTEGPSGINDAVTQTINGLQTQIGELRNMITSSLQTTDHDTLMNEKITHLEGALDEIRNGRSSDLENDLVYDVQQIKEKLSNIEGRVYKLMSGALTETPSQAKKTKEKPNPEQIVLFGDEIMTLSDLEKPVKEKFDFGDLQKTDDPNPAVESGDNQPEDESEIVPVSQEGNQNPEIEPVSEIPVPIADASEAVADTVSQPTGQTGNHPEISPAIPASSKAQEDNEARKIIKTEDAEIVDSEHSQLVRKISTDRDSFYESMQQATDTKKSAEPPAAPEKPEAPIRTISLKELANDEFSHYSVAIIERILHSSRTPNAREDRGRIINLWKSITSGCTKEMADIAQLLHEGQIVAVGEKEFILTYPTTSLCNQVMKMKFKRESLKFLYEYLGDSYNYIALPEDIWNEKRTEYINQYNIGIRFPKITPISDPNLSVEKENQEYLKSQERMVNRAMEMFGGNIVKIE